MTGWTEHALAPFGVEVRGVDLAQPWPEGLGDRLKVLRDRHKVQEMVGNEISQKNVMKAIAGG